MFDSHFLFGSKDCLWSSLASVMLCFCTEVSELLGWRHTSLASYCLIRWDSSKLFKFLLCIKPSSTKILFFDCHTRPSGCNIRFFRHFLISIVFCLSTIILKFLSWRHTSLASHSLAGWNHSITIKLLFSIETSCTEIFFFDSHARTTCSKGMRLFFDAHTIGTQSILRCCDSISGSFLFSCQSCRAEILFLLCQPRALSLIYNWLRDNRSLGSISFLLLLCCKPSHTFCRSGWLLWPSCKWIWYLTRSCSWWCYWLFT